MYRIYDVFLSTGRKIVKQFRFFIMQMGALAVKSRGQMSSLDGDLTYLGHVISRLPVDPHLAKLIVMGFLFGCLRECVVIGEFVSYCYTSGPVIDKNRHHKVNRTQNQHPFTNTC